MDSDGYHLTMTDNQHTKQDRWRKHVGWRKRQKIEACDARERTSDRFQICIGQFQPTNKNLIDKEGKLREKT